MHHTRIGAAREYGVVRIGHDAAPCDGVDGSRFLQLLQENRHRALNGAAAPDARRSAARSCSRLKFVDLDQ